MAADYRTLSENEPLLSVGAAIAAIFRFEERRKARFYESAEGRFDLRTNHETGRSWNSIG